MKREEDINNYLHGRLSEEDRVLFEKEMVNDLSLRNQVLEIETIINGVKESERQELKERLKVLKNSTESINNKKKIKKLKPYYLLVAAASVIGIIMLTNSVFFNTNKSTDELYADYFKIYPNTMQPVIRDANSIDPTTKAFIAYEAGNFKEASILFSESVKVETNSDLSFYYAMSLLNERKYNKSLVILNNLISDNKSSYILEIYWYSALLEFKIGNKEKAIELLDLLITLKSDFRVDSVIQLKADLKKMN